MNRIESTKMNRIESTKMKYLEKNGTNIDTIDSVKKNHKDLLKNNRMLVKTQQRFKSKRHKVFTEDCFKLK